MDSRKDNKVYVIRSRQGGKGNQEYTITRGKLEFGI